MVKEGQNLVEYLMEEEASGKILTKNVITLEVCEVLTPPDDLELNETDETRKANTEKIRKLQKDLKPSVLAFCNTLNESGFYVMVARCTSEVTSVKEELSNAMENIIERILKH